MLYLRKKLAVKRYALANPTIRPDEIWGTDLMYLRIVDEQYFLIAFIDDYSRYLVHLELVSAMDGTTLSTAAQASLSGRKRDHGTC